MVSNFLIGLFLTKLIMVISSEECPDFEITPCNCTIKGEQSFIYCDQENMRLKEIFHDISTRSKVKHFGFLRLNTRDIEVLEDNTFDQVTFDHILLKGCDHLQTIRDNAFSGTDKVTKSLQLLKFQHQNLQGGILPLIKKFVNLEDLLLYKTNLVEIPEEAFKDHHDTLKVITIYDPNLTKIGKMAFSGLKGLTNLELLMSRIEKFPENAFSIESRSKTRLKILISQRVEMSFDEKAFEGLRNTTLEFDIEFPKKLNQFKQFLLYDKDNKMHLGDNPIDCSDCNNEIIKMENIKKRIDPTMCMDNLAVDDSKHFTNCKI